MRTTITLDEGLLAQLKRRASDSGTSVSKLIEQAVRLFVRDPRQTRSRGTFDLVTFGANGRFTRENVDKTAALLEADDIARFSSRR